MQKLAMEYNYAKLLGKIKECGYTQESFAKKIGISACSLNLTLNNKRDFRQDEILKAGTALGVSPDQLHDYFFAHDL